MPIITLTSDLGSRDYYVASLKGTLLSACPDALLVDVTHEIQHFNLIEAAFAIRNSFQRFPAGSVHLIAVDPEGGGHQKGIIMRYRGHYFIAPDNGLLSLVKEKEPVECRLIEPSSEVDYTKGKSFMSLNVLARAAGIIASGGNLDELGSEHQMKEYFWGAPSYNEDALRGTIVHIDHFGNAITNIHRELFLELKQEKSFAIFLRKLKLKRIVSTYADVSKGDALGLFSDAGLLEIAIREGSAQKLLGLNVQDMLTIEFYR